MIPANATPRFRWTGAALLIVAASVILTACGSSAPSTSTAVEQTSLRVRIDSLLDQPKFSNSFWGVKIVDLESGVPLFERNAGKSLVPASNMKLYTTAAGLDHLGPDYRWTTRLLALGSVRNDTLFGDLVVVGSGDPSIGGPLSNGDITAVFRAWADSLKSAGIRHVTGDIIGDDDRFDDTPLGRGWMWDDETDWYSAEIGALTFNDNCIDLTVEGGVVGDTAMITWEPLDTDYVTVLNQTLTLPPDSAADVSNHRRRASNIIEVSTWQPQGESNTDYLTISNPTLYFTHVFGEVVQMDGVTIGGSPRDIDELFHKPVYTSAGMTTIATHTSPPLSEIVAAINKPSHNLYAELLLKTLGSELAVARGDSTRMEGTASLGARAVVETLVRAGADTAVVVIADGSGLSRYNMITPDATVDLLTYMWTHPDSAVTGAYIRSLPVGGVDGTLATLVSEGPAVGNLMAKTGTMTGVRSLSGYIRTSDGRPIVFSLISNNHVVPTSEVNEVFRDVMDLLARL